MEYFWLTVALLLLVLILFRSIKSATLKIIGEKITSVRSILSEAQDSFDKAQYAYSHALTESKSIEAEIVKMKSQVADQLESMKSFYIKAEKDAIKRYRDSKQLHFNVEKYLLLLEFANEVVDSISYKASLSLSEMKNDEQKDLINRALALLH